MYEVRNGRPPKKPEDRARYQLVAVDYNDYVILKQLSQKESLTIKELVHRLLT